MLNDNLIITSKESLDFENLTVNESAELLGNYVKEIGLCLKEKKELNKFVKDLEILKEVYLYFSFIYFYFYIL
jgi:hypothetical protein